MGVVEVLRGMLPRAACRRPGHRAQPGRGGAGAGMGGARAEALAAVLGLDMAAWWKPTAEGYLSQISKVQIVAAVGAAQSPEAAKLLPAKTKGELVAAAEIALRDTRWLPQVLLPGTHVAPYNGIRYTAA